MGTIIFGLFITCFVGVAESKKCWAWGREAKCFPDLSGYEVCDGYGRNGKLTYVTCPGNTRCACFLGNECSIVQPNGYRGEWGVKEENICQVLPAPFPVKEVLHLTYKKGGWESRYDGDYLRFNQEGDVKQDLTKQSAIYTWGIFEHRRFKIIIPDGKGEFIKFYGKYNPNGPNRCRKTKLKTFPEFAGEIKNWRLKETKKENGIDKQMWYNQIFRIEDGKGLTRRWTVLSDPVKKHVVPVRYHDTYTGTQEEMCCDHSVYVDYKEVNVEPNTNTDDWFQVPEFCP